MAWFVALFISSSPFIFLRFFMGWQDVSHFKSGLMSGILIKELLPDSCYVCVAVGLAYWSDLFLTKRQFDQTNSVRFVVLNYINIILFVEMTFAGVLYFIDSLLDKRVFIVNFDPTYLIRDAVVLLFLTIIIFTFIGEQLLHELELRRAGGATS
jgi:hypothetical protein